MGTCISENWAQILRSVVHIWHLCSVALLNTFCRNLRLFCALLRSLCAHFALRVQMEHVLRSVYYIFICALLRSFCAIVILSLRAQLSAQKIIIGCQWISMGRGGFHSTFFGKLGLQIVVRPLDPPGNIVSLQCPDFEEPSIPTMTHFILGGTLNQPKEALAMIKTLTTCHLNAIMISTESSYTP